MTNLVECDGKSGANRVLVGELKDSIGSKEEWEENNDNKNGAVDIIEIFQNRSKWL